MLLQKPINFDNLITSLSTADYDFLIPVIEFITVIRIRIVFVRGFVLAFLCFWPFGWWWRFAQFQFVVVFNFLYNSHCTMFNFLRQADKNLLIIAMRHHTTGIRAYLFFFFEIVFAIILLLVLAIDKVIQIGNRSRFVFSRQWIDFQFGTNEIRKSITPAHHIRQRTILSDIYVVMKLKLKC